MSKRQKVESGAVSAILRGSQQTSKPAKNQQASKPAKTSERKKATFQLDRYDITLLENERYQRRMAGKSANLSELVREAIRAAYGSKQDKQQQRHLYRHG
jgi:hypothetical protein